MQTIARRNGVSDYSCPEFEVEYEVEIEVADGQDEDEVRLTERNTNTTVSNSPPRITQTQFTHLMVDD